jgi:hypothetical protein
MKLYLELDPDYAMNDEKHDSDFSSFTNLLEASKKIQTGVKGTDFLVLVNNDEMCGYMEMPFEVAFCNAVKQTVELLSINGVDVLTSNPQIGCLVLTALVQAQSAAYAYRSRMFKYATDWGSEISPVGVCQRELFSCFRNLISKISDKARKQILKRLPRDLRGRFIFTYYWISSDKHSSSSIRVIDLLANR